MRQSNEAKQLPEHAPDSIYEITMKKGMKFVLLCDVEDTGSRRGDTVTISNVSSIFKGVKSDGHYNDYELLRVSNGKFTWRESRGNLFQVE